MKKQKTTLLTLWTGCIILSSLVLLNLHEEYRTKSGMLDKSIKEVFHVAVAEDTNRRTKELGDSFQFSYRPVFKEDSITITTMDTVMRMRNNREVAERMSDKAKIDFTLQHCLSFENPIRVDSLDRIFHSLLAERHIPARTAIVYTLNNKHEYSDSDSSFYQSAEFVGEVAFGSTKLIVLQGFVQVPFSYKIGKVISSSSLLFSVWLLVLLVALWLTFSKTKKNIQLLPVPVAPKELLQITPDLLFDKKLGLLYYKNIEVELINQRKRLFLYLLERRGIYIDSETLRVDVWPDGSVSKDALSSTIKRLREDLSPISGISIESSRGKGYVLNVADSVLDKIEAPFQCGESVSEK